MVFDLDPREGTAYDFVILTALRLRERWEEDGYSRWPKLSGGKGIHLLVPLDGRQRHDAASAPK
jgi:bifunctional non-homologous end joining protein LigD